MKKLSFAKKEVSKCEGCTENFLLEYYIVCSSCDKRRKTAKYGLAITKTAISAETRCSECKIIPNVTASKKSITKIIAAFCRNTVTPYTAEEILEEVVKSRMYSKL